MFGKGSAEKGSKRDDELAAGVAALSSVSVPRYNASYPCEALYKGFVEQACPTWNVSDPSDPIPFDRSWHEHNLRTFALPLRAAHDVPLFMNQFEVVHGVSATAGRYGYITDLLALAKQLDVGWAWWTWRGGGDTDWKNGSTEIIYDYSNGSVGVDMQAIEALSPGTYA